MARVRPWLCWLVVGTACGGGAADGIEVTEAFGFAPATASEAAVYLTLHNRGPGDDTLVRVSSPEAAGAMVHRSVTAGAMVTMEHVDRLPLPAGEPVRMAPGALHLMLVDLAPIPRAGDSLTIILEFARGASQTVRVPVIPYGDPPDPGGVPEVH